MRTRFTYAYPAWGLAAFLTASACGGSKPPVEAPPQAAKPQHDTATPEHNTAPTPAAVQLEQLRWQANGKSVRWPDVRAALKNARVILVGERHTAPLDHGVQLALMKALTGKTWTLGLESVQIPFQPALDAFNAGDISLEQLAKRIEYKERWGYPLSLYGPLFDRAKQQGWPVLALNAPSEWTRIVGRYGLTRATSAFALDLPEIDVSDAAHKRFVLAKLRQHPGMSEAILENYYAAQVLWDTTMAQRIEGAADENRVFAVAGIAHVAFGLGISRRFSAALPHVIIRPAQLEMKADAERNVPEGLLAEFVYRPAKAKAQ